MANDLTKVTVNLVPRSVAALEAAAESTGDSKTNTINRALQLWAYVMKELDDGSELHLLDGKGDLRQIVLM